MQLLFWYFMRSLLFPIPTASSFLLLPTLASVSAAQILTAASQLNDYFAQTHSASHILTHVYLPTSIQIEIYAIFPRRPRGSPLILTD